MWAAVSLQFTEVITVNVNYPSPWKIFCGCPRVYGCRHLSLRGNVALDTSMRCDMNVLNVLEFT